MRLPTAQNPRFCRCAASLAAGWMLFCASAKSTCGQLPMLPLTSDSSVVDNSRGTVTHGLGDASEAISQNWMMVDTNHHPWQASARPAASPQETTLAPVVDRWSLPPGEPPESSDELAEAGESSADEVF